MHPGPIALSQGSPVKSGGVFLAKAHNLMPGRYPACLFLIIHSCCVLGFEYAMRKCKNVVLSIVN